MCRLTVERPALPGSRIVVALMAMMMLEASPTTRADEPVGGEPVQQEPAETPVDGLQEPAEDKPLELKDESGSIDPSNKDALAYYMAGQKALKQGELQAAADAFQKSSEAAPKSGAPLRALAMVQFRLGNVEEGLARARQAMDQDPNDYETRLQLAIFFGTRRQFQDAGLLIDQALDSTTLKKESFDYVHLHQVRSAVMLESRNLSEAANSYEIILKALERPEDFNLSEREHNLLLKNRISGYETTGRVLLDAGRVPKAIQAFEALGRTADGAPGDHNLLLARAYFQQDKLDLCESNLNTYFESDRRSTDSLVLLRDLYEASQRSDALPTRLEELSQETSDATVVQMFLGQTLLDRGETEKAREVYQTILDSSGDADAYLGLVRVEISNRNASALIATINRAANSRISAVELTPLVSSIVTTDDFAGSTIDTCLSLNKDKPGELHPTVTYFCSLIAHELELADKETELLQATLELNPDRELTLETLDRYGMNRLQAGDYERAARIFEQMLTTPGLPPGARINTLFRISAAYAQIKDLAAARKALREALRMVPNEPQLLSRLALIEAADGKLDAAEELLLMAIEGLQGNVELLNEARIQLAGVFAQQDKWQEAIEQYRFVMNSDGVDPETKRLSQMGLSNAFVQQGDLEEGQKVLEEVYNEDPTDPGINNDLGYLYADQGKNLEQAEKMIRIAVEAQPENPAYLDSLGWVLFKLGRHEEALEPLIKANSDPDYQDSTLLEHQGDVHQALNQPDKAREMWERAKKVEDDAPRPAADVLKRLTEKLKAAEAPPAAEATQSGDK